MLRILLATFVSWTGLRLTEVALPLIALQQTGSVWATGLVAGSSGIALLTSPVVGGAAPPPADLRPGSGRGPRRAGARLSSPWPSRRRWTASPWCTCASAA